MTTFEELLGRLTDAAVDYALVGGLACALNGYPRATEDVDIVVGADANNLERLLAVLRTFGAGHAAELTVDDFPVEPGAVRVVEEFAVDIFTEIGGRTLEAWQSNLRWYKRGSLRIPYLDADALIAMKSQSVRGKDQDDVVVLRRLRAAG